LRIELHGLSRWGALDLVTGLKSHHVFFFKKNYNSLYFFIELFQTHDLGCRFGEISRFGSTLIIVVIGLAWPFFYVIFLFYFDIWTLFFIKKNSLIPRQITGTKPSSDRKRKGFLKQLSNFNFFQKRLNNDHVGTDIRYNLAERKGFL